VKKLVWDHAER